MSNHKISLCSCVLSGTIDTDHLPCLSDPGFHILLVEQVIFYLSVDQLVTWKNKCDSHPPGGGQKNPTLRSSFKGRRKGKEAFTTHRHFHAARYPSPTSDSKVPSQPLPRLLSPDFCWAEDGDNATGFAAGGVESERGAPLDLDQMRLSRASMKMVSRVYCAVGASV